VRELWLDLIGPSTDGKTGMTVSGVTSGTEALSFTHENNRISIQLGGPSKAGDRRRITIRYAGVAGDGLLIGPNKHSERVFFGDNFPDRARHWLPTIDHPSDKAACEFVITAPEAYQVVAPGALVETSSLPGNRRLTRYRQAVPVTTYCMVIGVARFAVETVGHVGGAPIQSWVYSAERDPGFADFRIAMKPMQLFSWRVGPYSYERLANVQSKTRCGGMENASTIFYSERVVTGRGTNEGLFAHEIAHQWFGDSVTEADWDHTWLDNILSTNSYQKGGWFLHMLRRLVGDEVFWRGVSTYYARYQNGNALTDDFRRVMEEVSGKALEAFFRQWVFTPGQPAIAGSWVWANGVLTVEIRQTQTTTTVYQTALDIGIVVDRAAAPRIETVSVDQRVQTFTIELDKEPVDVVLDPGTWLLMKAGEFVRKTVAEVTGPATGR